MIQPLTGPSPPAVMHFRKALRENGLIALFRPPLLHCCPPLVITEAELRDGFQRLSSALSTLDAVQKPYITDEMELVRQDPSLGDEVLQRESEEEPLYQRFTS